MEVSKVLEVQESSVKLMKMTKGYNWEIKIYDSDDKKMFERVLELDKLLREKYPPL